MNHGDKYPSRRLVLRLLTDYFGDESQAFALIRRFSPLKLCIPSIKEVERMATARRIYARVKANGADENAIAATALCFGISASEVKKIVKVETAYETRYALLSPATKRQRMILPKSDSRCEQIFPIRLKRVRPVRES